MRKKSGDKNEEELEILKAVAQAWLSHSGKSSTTKEWDAYRVKFQARPSRFRQEAKKQLRGVGRAESANWDFRQSLWDSYEIVNVTEKLERALVLDDMFAGIRYQRKKESKNSLRNLFKRASSRLFNAA